MPCRKEITGKLFLNSKEDESWCVVTILLMFSLGILGIFFFFYFYEPCHLSPVLHLLLFYINSPLLLSFYEET